MVNSARLRMFGMNVGAFVWDSQYNLARFEYDSSFAKLVRECGIDMTECSLIEENGRAHFLTRRFDRKGGKKIHMQTLCGIAHFDHRIHRAYSYEQAFNVMRSLKLTYAEAAEMFRRMVFNVVVRNQICECVSQWPAIARNCGVPEKMIQTIRPNMLLNL